MKVKKNNTPGLAVEVILWILFFTAVFMLLYHKFIFSLIYGIILGPVFGIGRKYYPRLFLFIMGGDGNVNHTLEMEVEEEPEMVFNLVKDVLAAIPGKLVINKNEYAKNIEARVGSFWRWPGNKITINITQENLSKIKIYINSRPAMSTNYADGGHNYKNIMAFERAIKNNLTVLNSLHSFEEKFKI